MLVEIALLGSHPKIKPKKLCRHGPCQQHNIINQSKPERKQTNQQKKKQSHQMFVAIIVLENYPNAQLDSESAAAYDRASSSLASGK